MFEMPISLPVARNAMRLISAGAVTDAFETLGITKEDFKMACSDVPYIAADRPRVSAVLESLTHGVCDVIGMPRVEVPMEFRAGVLCCFVAPGNLAIACRWTEREPTADDIVSGGSLEPATAKQLFALCIQLSEEAPAARAAWEKRTKRSIRDVEVKPQQMEMSDAQEGSRQKA